MITLSQRNYLEYLCSEYGYKIKSDIITKKQAGMLIGFLTGLAEQPTNLFELLEYDLGGKMITDNFYEGCVMFANMTVDTEYNQNEDITYFTTRVYVIYDGMEEIIEGSIPGNSISDAELDGIIEGVKSLYENRKILVSITNINNDKLEQILTKQRYIKKVIPRNIVLDEKQIQLIKLIREKQNIKVLVKQLNNEQVKH